MDMIEDKLLSNFPSNQNAIDCFPDLWYSKFPEEFNVKAGESLLFHDHRLLWALEQLKPSRDWNVLELGPLEGGHSYYLEKQAKVKSITAVEANRLCWTKCLITKEITKLQNTHFLLGNFLEFLKSSKDTFDLCVAIGVLYHMKDPLELIKLLARRTNRLIIWTQIINDRKEQERESIQLNDGDFRVTGFINHYGKAIDSGKFIGGIEDYAVWLTREGLHRVLNYFGFTKIKV